MELRQLRYFLVVAHELHFGRAAERLHISQPPLSTQIRALEKELGYVLFQRSTRRVSLTSVGREFRDRISEVIADLDRTVDGLFDVHAGRAGTLRVGFVSSASYQIIPEAVSAFHGIAPGIKLTLLPMTTGEQIDLLQEGGLDLGIVGSGGPTAGLRSELLITEDLVACVPHDHPLAAASEVTVEQLSTEPMISYSYRLMPGYVSEVLELFGGTPVRPHVVQRAVHQETVLGFVAAGLGFAILPASVRAISPRGVVHVPIASRPTTSTVLLSPRDGTASHSAAAFSQCLREAVQEREAESNG